MVKGNDTVNLLKLMGEYGNAMNYIVEQIKQGSTGGCFGQMVYENERDDWTKEQQEQFGMNGDLEIIVSWKISIE